MIVQTYTTIRAFLQIACLCFFALGANPSACEAAAAPEKTVPTKITANQMEYSADRQTVTFTGNVYVKRPDFELWAQAMTVYLEKNGEKQKAESTGSVDSMKTGTINRIVAKTNVRMKSGEKEGTSQLATYYAKEDKFVMEGSPLLREKENTIRGEVITHYIKANKSQVQRSVEVNFLAPDNTLPGIKPGSSPK